MGLSSAPRICAAFGLSGGTRMNSRRRPGSTGGCGREREASRLRASLLAECPADSRQRWPAAEKLSWKLVTNDDLVGCVELSQTTKIRLGHGVLIYCLH